MAALDVYMNGYRVGILTKTGSGTHHFSYDANWLGLPGNRPISLSMPLRHQPYQGDDVYNFFDNLFRITRISEDALSPDITLTPPSRLICWRKWGKTVSVRCNW
ncbi:hypothetical protein OI69_03985 [Pectobacterium fontis]|uniref:HipA N-terminal subdomain 1 domain-containing protein n=1 Tax=Pectobacterium fontis TaxID=2558042 RepID=A0A7V8IL09_9GAMM|nr:HipA N-terminal domain-containing protein [Pectobacterium fontis]KHN54435.1 hypothetical protein OI69_03985 [Pectobacterium fontis]